MPVAFQATEPPGLQRSRAAEEQATLDAARLITFAVTALLISFLVIGRTSSFLDTSALASGSTLESGRVELHDDDHGATLFDLPDLLPGTPVSNCLEVAYRGSEFDGEVLLTSKGGGKLAPYLDTEILVGEGGGFGDCDGFRPNGAVFDGTLEELASEHGIDGRPLQAFTLDRARVVRTFKFTFTLRDDPRAERGTATTSFEWSVDA
jgi:hypothetical protein